MTARPDRTSALLAARLVGHRVQISGESTESSNTYANADGTLTVESAAGPLQVRRGEAWVPVDTTLALSAGRVAPKAVPEAVSFSAGGSGPLVSAVDGESRKIIQSWPSALPAPTLAGDTATYPNVVAGGDLLLLATREGWEVSLRLRTRPKAPLVINIPMSYAGLRLTQNADKSLVWKDMAGKRVAVSPAPVMFDAAVNPGTGEPARSAAVASAVVDGGKTLRLSPDSGFLDDPATVYPVTVDPSTSFSANGGAYVDSGFPTTAYYNPTELKVGTYDGGAHKLRAYLTFQGRVNVIGTHVLSASLLLYNRYSYSCTTRPFYVKALTSGYTYLSTWNTQPGLGAQYGTKTFAHGYSSSCPGAYESTDVTGLVAGWATGSIPTQQLALTASETDSFGWKRFNSPQSGSGIPTISVTYNTKPGAAGSQATAPSLLTGGARFTPTATPTLSGRSVDPDGNTVQLKDEVWAWNGTTTTGTAPVAVGYTPFVASGATASWTVSPALVNGSSYAWRAATWDGTDWNGTWSPWQVFTVDTTVPNTPTVTSSSFPSSWSSPTSGTVSISAIDPGGAVSGYQYQLDGAGTWTPTTSGTITLSDVPAGQHSLLFQTVDRAGNLSPSGTLILNAGGLASPADQARTQAQVSLQATPTAPTGRPWVSYQWRTDTTAAYAGLGGTNVVGGATWPEQPVSGAYPAHVWNIATDAGHDGLVQVRACYGVTATDSVASLQCAAPSNVQIATTNFGAAAATTAVGPGSLALLTGDYQVSAGDVNVPSYNGSLTVGRSLTTLAPSTITTGAEGVFGPGWTASLPGPDAGAADLTLSDQSAQGYAVLTDPEGAEYLYVVRAGDPNSFDGHGDATDGSVLHKDSTTQFTLTDPDGTKTVWTKTGALWGVSAVIEPGSDSTTTYTRDTSGRVTQILAPVPAGVTCTTPSTTAGCRTLALTYATATTATATVPGDYTGRLQKITFTAYNPQTAAMVTVEVAHYAYDTTGHLREAWDPRISPALKTSYTYDTNGRLATLTPPGLAGWTLGYDAANRISTITRPDPSGPTATTTIAYGVPLTGDAALPDLSAAQTDRWGQRDVPTKATAVFGPDHVPAGAPAAADWPYASVSYLDVNGRQTNTASYGAGGWQISTSEYDKYGNTIRTLGSGSV